MKNYLILKKHHITLSFVFFALFSWNVQAVSPYSDPTVWHGKFIYGAYSTLISSYILGTEFTQLISLLNDPENNKDLITQKISAYKTRYNSLTDDEVKSIVLQAQEDHTNSIYEEERSITTTWAQNGAFLTGMANTPALEPVDNLISSQGFISPVFQFNAHRAVYNNAYGIPQNSLAAMISAYVAGIRSIEFDVLETKDKVNVIVHDLVTNRLDGKYSVGSNYVDKKTFDEIKDTKIQVLNVLNEATGSVESTLLTNLIRTDVALKFLNAHLPLATFYIDARNDSPVSLIKIIQDNPTFRDLIVLKIYPFTLTRGIDDLSTLYAIRYAAEIKDVMPNVLLALGSVAEQAANSVAGLDVLDWGVFQDKRQLMPYSRTSTSSAKTFQGQSIFTDQELMLIETNTFKLFNWAFGFASDTRLMVLQIGLLPSIEYIVTQSVTPQTIAKYNAIPLEYKISSAVKDNFLTLYDKVKSGDLVIKIGTVSLKDRLTNTILGFSDRFPDFSFAKREGLTVDQSTLKDYIYSMGGVVYQKNDFAALIMRSSATVLSKIQERTDYKYATTDLPTDLRYGFMGLLGQHALPSEIKFHKSGLIKEKFTPQDIPAYEPPNWTKQLYNNAFTLNPTKFNEISAQIISSTQRKDFLFAAYLDMTYAMQTNDVLLNFEALKRLGLTEPKFMNRIIDQFGYAKVDQIRQQIRSEYITNKNNIITYKNTFQSIFGSSYDWEELPSSFPQPSS